MSEPRAPLRVACLAGAYVQPGARRFISMLDAHPQIDLVLILCQGTGGTWLDRLADLWTRRRWLLPAVLLMEGISITLEFVCEPAAFMKFSRSWSRLRHQAEWYPNLHAPRAVERLRQLCPDLAVVYGAPLLKPEIFNLPRLGTLGIHHGRVPAYRGRKTTFWEMYHGERHAGITIQRIGEGIDTGEVVATGQVEIDERSYSSVWREVERVGCELFLQAVLEVQGEASQPVRQDHSISKGRLFKQPSVWQIATLRWHRRRALRRHGDT